MPRDHSDKDRLDTEGRPDAVTSGRRRFMTSLAMGGLALTSGVATFPFPGRAEVMRGDTAFKVVDWRCRPPLPQYAGLYRLRTGPIANRPTVLNNPATRNPPPDFTEMLDDTEAAMIEYWKEVDRSGIDVTVSNGRWGAGIPSLTIDNDALIELQSQYAGKFMGLAMLNLDLPIEETVADLERAIAGGLRGANLEPGYRTKNGGATTIDNADFFPIFETMIAADLPLMVQTGQAAGIFDWNDANEIWRFDNVLTKFPNLKIVLAHGGYPRQTEALALANKHPNAYLCPDVYMFWAGGQLYQANLDMLQDQMIYGSAFPFANMDAAIEQTLALDVSDDVLSKYLYGNAARLLQL